MTQTKPKNFLRTVPIAELTKKKQPTAISLFSGAGGAALGLAAAGFEIRVMVEWEEAACETLKLNWVNRPKNWREVLAAEKEEQKRKLKRARSETRKWFIKTYETPHYWWQERPPAIMNVDITKTSTAKILKRGGLQVGEADILEGGFPCQGFSVAGARRMNDPRNQLYHECVRVIREALPRSFMLENVPGLTSMDKGRVMKRIIRDLTSVGYDVSWDIHDAADFGVPQRRKRVIIIGRRIDVAVMTARGRLQLHMGVGKGKEGHPDWFKKKYRHRPKQGAKNAIMKAA